VQVCPVACIPVDPQHVESRDQLMARYLRLQAAPAPMEAPSAADVSADGPPPSARA
jgi:hypothetical protein